MWLICMAEAVHLYGLLQARVVFIVINEALPRLCDLIALHGRADSHSSLQQARHEIARTREPAVHAADTFISGVLPALCDLLYLPQQTLRNLQPDTATLGGFGTI